MTDAQVIDPDSITDELAEDQPEPNEHVIQEETGGDQAEAGGEQAGGDQAGGSTYAGASASAPADPGGLVDRHGNGFDPSMHVTDEQGEPKLTSRGYLKLKRGKAGASSGSSAGSGSTVSGPEGMRPGEAADDGAQAREAGRNAADALIMLGMTLGGPEWEPVRDKRQGIDERGNLREAWGQYFEAKGVSDIPPGVALAIATLGYAAPRLVQGPTTKSRLQRAGLWLKGKLGAFRKRKGKKGEQADQAEGGDGT